MSTETEAKFYDLSEDALLTVSQIIEKMALPFNIKIKYLGSTKLKKLISLKKTSDEISYINGIDLIVFINEDYLIKLDDKNAEILLTQEFDRLQFDISKGTFKIAKFELQTNTGILNKYGIDAVAEANELSELLTQQIKDGKEDEEIKSSSKRSTVQFIDEN